MSITFSKVTHTYSAGTPYAYEALKGVDLTFSEGRMTAVIGQTGSGKSTLVQHLNALLLPDSGTVEVMDWKIKGGEKPKKLKELRGKVGLVFQFPEYQLFEETVLKDVSFGPKNFGCHEEEAVQKAEQALKLTGLGEEFYEKSPLELSGGQKRRVAIAGILAMDPSVLVLDEPTAGLDPEGTNEMMALFSRLNHEFHKTVIMVTHDMENVFRYCDEVVVMSNGLVKVHTDAKEFFKDTAKCAELDILPPAVIQMKDMLKDRGFAIDENVMSVEELADAVAREVKNHG